MQLKTLALAAVFAVTSSFAFAQSGGSNTSSPEKPAGTMQKGTTVDRPSESTSGIHRLVLNSAISAECFQNMAIRLLVSSAMILGNSTGDLIVASL